MKVRRDARGLDEIDRHILGVLQDDCKMPMAKVGELVGLSAPSIVERIRKLENEGFIRGYHAELDATRLGLDVTAFIGVSVNHPRSIEAFDQRLTELEGVLECHHVTGGPTLLLKVKTRNTTSLQSLISTLRSIPGVARTETNVVLKTLAEDNQIGVELAEPVAEPSAAVRRSREAPASVRTAIPRGVALEVGTEGQPHAAGSHEVRSTET